MKEFNSQEYNRLCCEFINTPVTEIWFDNRTNQILDIKYLYTFERDWNRIMEIVEKIKPIVFMSKTRPLTDHNTNLCYALMSAKKEAVVQAIWEILNWYNTNKK